MVFLSHSFKGWCHCAKRSFAVCRWRFKGESGKLPTPVGGAKKLHTGVRKRIAQKTFCQRIDNGRVIFKGRGSRGRGGTTRAQRSPTPPPPLSPHQLFPLALLR